MQEWVGAPIHPKNILVVYLHNLNGILIIFRKKMNMYVHQELVALTEHTKKKLKEKNTNYFLGVGPPWRVGPVDLVTPVSMVA